MPTDSLIFFIAVSSKEELKKTCEKTNSIITKFESNELTFPKI